MFYFNQYFRNWWSYDPPVWVLIFLLMLAALILPVGSFLRKQGEPPCELEKASVGMLFTKTTHCEKSLEHARQRG